MKFLFHVSDNADINDDEIRWLTPYLGEDDQVIKYMFKDTPYENGIIEDYAIDGMYLDKFEALLAYQQIISGRQQHHHIHILSGEPKIISGSFCGYEHTVLVDGGTLFMYCDRVFDNY
jgi:hypothetical protein